MLLRQDVPRFSLAQVRAQFPPRIFKDLTAVSLKVGEVTFRAEIVREPDVNCRGGYRRWLACPSCGRTTTVLGVLPGAVQQLACFRCAKWREPPRTPSALPLPSEATP